jgi:hypothetical protein
MKTETESENIVDRERESSPYQFFVLLTHDARRMTRFPLTSFLIFLNF